MEVYISPRDRNVKLAIRKDNKDATYEGLGLAFMDFLEHM